jgi:hypothetical protein
MRGRSPSRALRFRFFNPTDPREGWPNLQVFFFFGNTSDPGPKSLGNLVILVHRLQVVPGKKKLEDKIAQSDVYTSTTHNAGQKECVEL